MIVSYTTWIVWAMMNREKSRGRRDIQPSGNGSLPLPLRAAEASAELVRRVAMFVGLQFTQHCRVLDPPGGCHA
jgi:hypothetical protein